MAKNQIVNIISKAEFTRKVVDGTNQFRAIYENGTGIDYGTDSFDFSGLNDEMKALGICKELRDAQIATLKSVLKKEAKGKTPSADKLAKEHLVFVPFAAVVCVRNWNNHVEPYYPIGEVVIMVHGTPGADEKMYGMDKYGCVRQTGKELPRLRKTLRPATASEILRFVDFLYRG